MLLCDVAWWQLLVLSSLRRHFLPDVFSRCVLLIMAVAAGTLGMWTALQHASYSVLAFSVTGEDKFKHEDTQGL